jgi:coenzyme F420-0:L-glutamate ligase/coenzyme F420-1:gamma-L-glutamate ligase
VRKIEYTALSEIPLIKADDDLSQIIINASNTNKITIQDGDIFVIAQKIVSKAEDRLVDLRKVRPGIKAKWIAFRSQKDPRLVQLILNESKRILRIRRGLIIVEHKNGFVCANAGIDHSNSTNRIDAENFVLLLPMDADRSASLIRTKLETHYKKRIGILIIDSHGRAWRNGTVGTSIGFSGIPGLVDLRGKPDLFGYILRVTKVAAADELAAGASLLMGQADESTPCIHVRGFPYELGDSKLDELIRSKKQDLFR